MSSILETRRTVSTGQRRVGARKTHLLVKMSSRSFVTKWVMDANWEGQRRRDRLPSRQRARKSYLGHGTLAHLVLREVVDVVQTEERVALDLLQGAAGQQRPGNSTGG